MRFSPVSRSGKVHRNFVEIEPIFGTIYVYKYAISEGLKIPGGVPI